MKRHLLIPVLILLCHFIISSATISQEKIKALIVDGQNNHKNWPQTTELMQSYLTESGKFEVEIARTKENGTDEDFSPAFADFDVVISNYNGAEWPKETKANFEKYMKEGGGFVVIHAANNAFGAWDEYNKIIGLGGWGGRNEQSGPYVYYRDDKLIVDESEGNGGSHGRQHPFQIIMRDDKHPIAKNVPAAWMHVNDELYDRLRGPASDMTVLATAFSDKANGGTGRHEPMIMTVKYGEGRVFHTPMGHGNDSQQCVGFITLLLRGTEWAATGEVTIEVPDDFPEADKTSSREYDFEKDDD